MPALSAERVRIQEVQAASLRLGWVYERAGQHVALCPSFATECVLAARAYTSRDAALDALIRHHQKHHGLGAVRIAA
jgi:hypothetical protein